VQHGAPRCNTAHYTRTAHRVATWRTTSPHGALRCNTAHRVASPCGTLQRAMAARAKVRCIVVCHVSCCSAAQGLQRKRSDRCNQAYCVATRRTRLVADSAKRSRHHDGRSCLTALASTSTSCMRHGHVVCTVAYVRRSSCRLHAPRRPRSATSTCSCTAAA
jgi:hypothetical protein